MKKLITIVGWSALVITMAIFIITSYTAERARVTAAAGLPDQSVFTTSGASPVNVTITSDPTGARVRVNARAVGTTPVTVQLDAGRNYQYELNAPEPYVDYKLYKPFTGTLTANEDTTISVWIDRTTAQEQATERQATEEARRAREEAKKAQEQARKEAEERAEREQQRRLEAERLYYRIETNCRSGANLTYSNAYGDTTQQSNQGNGWYYYFVPKSGQFLYLSAQNQCDGGYVRVKFVKDGVTLRENTSSGSYVIATISGRW